MERAVEREAQASAADATTTNVQEPAAEVGVASSKGQERGKLLLGLQ
jgi:hypothetical protein